jgi:hypothetical protein
MTETGKRIIQVNGKRASFGLSKDKKESIYHYLLFLI